MNAFPIVINVSVTLSIISPNQLEEEETVWDLDGVIL